MDDGLVGNEELHLFRRLTRALAYPPLTHHLDTERRAGGEVRKEVILLEEG